MRLIREDDDEGELGFNTVLPWGPESEKRETDMQDQPQYVDEFRDKLRAGSEVGHVLLIW